MPARRRVEWGQRRINPGLPAAAVIATLGLVLAVALTPFVAGLLGALVLAVVFDPLHERLSRRLSRATAAAIVLAVAIALILVPGFCIGALLVRAVPQAIASADLAPFVARLDSLEFRGIAIGSEMANAGGALASWGSQRVFVIAGGAARAAINLVIAFFGLYYLLVSGESAWAEFSKYSPFSVTITERLRIKFRDITKATLIGIGVGSAAQALIVGTGFAVTGLPNPLVWGAMTGVLSVLPMLGASLIWVPGTIALAISGRIGAAIVLLVIGGGISAHVESFIRPMVSRRVSRIHPLITLVGAFAGIRYVGLAGLLLGPLALAYFFELVRAFELEFLGNPGTEVAAD